MPLITRQEKGTKLTIQDMDGNLTYLQSNGFVDGEYSQTLIGTGEIIGTIGDTIQFSNPIDSGTVGTYTVSPTTDGSGTGAQFELVVIEARGAFTINTNLSSSFEHINHLKEKITHLKKSQKDHKKSLNAQQEQ
jgi:hypothetical protein